MFTWAAILEVPSWVKSHPPDLGIQWKQLLHHPSLGTHNMSPGPFQKTYSLCFKVFFVKCKYCYPSFFSPFLFAWNIFFIPLLLVSVSFILRICCWLLYHFVSLLTNREAILLLVTVACCKRLINQQKIVNHLLLGTRLFTYNYLTHLYYWNRWYMKISGFYSSHLHIFNHWNIISVAFLLLFF